MWCPEEGSKYHLVRMQLWRLRSENGKIDGKRQLAN
jgi:hypothetical protein